MAETNAGIVTIDTSMLLRWLHLEGGEVIRVWTPDEVYRPNCYKFMIRHPSLPRVTEGCVVPEVVISLTTGDMCPCCGHREVKRVEIT